MTRPGDRRGSLTRIHYKTDGHPSVRLEAHEQAVIDAAAEGEDPPSLAESLAEKFESQTVYDITIPAGWEIVQTEWNTDTGEAWVTFFSPS
jgi:hypothetical protein